MSAPGFEGIDSEFLAELGQPVKVRLDVTANPVVEVSPLLGIFRAGSGAVRLASDWESDDVGPTVAISEDAVDPTTVIINDAEIDISNKAADGQGEEVVVNGTSYWVASWTTYKVANKRPDGVAMTHYRLHLK